MSDYIIENKTCVVCKGTGKDYWERWYGKELLANGDTCQNCYGSGIVKKYKYIENNNK